MGLSIALSFPLASVSNRSSRLRRPFLKCDTRLARYPILSVSWLRHIALLLSLHLPDVGLWNAPPPTDKTPRQIPGDIWTYGRHSWYPSDAEGAVGTRSDIEAAHTNTRMTRLHCVSASDCRSGGYNKW